jgi:hypothetical protein
MNLNMPAVRSGGGFTDKFQIKAGENRIRVYPFAVPGEDELQLAAPEDVHFIDQIPHACLGKGCPMCAESSSKNDKRMRRTTKYRMAVVDVGKGGDTSKVLAWPAPSSAYKAIRQQCVNAQNDPDMTLEDILGNEGTDVIIVYDKNAQPQDMYSVSLRLKGSKTLEIGDDDIPNLCDEAMTPDDDMVSPQGGADDDNIIQFIDEDGNEVEGIDTGKVRKGKKVIDVDGKLVYVDPDSIVGGEEVNGTDDEDSAKEDETATEIPDGHIECIACEGSGKSSTGKVCRPCKGEGHIPKPEDETGDGEGDEYEFDDDEYNVVIDTDDGPIYAIDEGKTKKVKGRIHHVMKAYDEDGEDVEYVIPKSAVLARQSED